MCQLDNKPYTIGYIVSELLDEMHTAIQAGKIVSVKFSWVKYITDWTRCGPKFFAGVAIERIGPWSPQAIRSASTR